MIVLSILLIISLVANGIFIWYTRDLLNKFFWASEAAGEILTRLKIYKNHLDAVHELKLFYGDRNLKELIDHTDSLIAFVRQFSNVYSFTQPDLEDLLFADEKEGADEKETSAEWPYTNDQSRSSGPSSGISSPP